MDYLTVTDPTDRNWKEHAKVPQDRLGLEWKFEIHADIGLPSSETQTESSGKKISGKFQSYRSTAVCDA